MPLEKGIKQFYFAQGVDSAFDAAATPTGKLHVLENGYFEKVGSIKKKPGFVASSTTVDNVVDSTAVSSTGVVYKVFSFASTKLLFAYNSASDYWHKLLFKWDAGRSIWQNTSASPTVLGSTTTPINQGKVSPHVLCDSWTFSGGSLYKDQIRYAYIDCEYYNGNVYYITANTNSSFTFGAYDYASKNVLFSKTFALGYRPILRKINNKMYIFWMDVPNTDLYVTEFDPATSIFSGNQLVVSNVIAGDIAFSVSFDVTNNRAYVLYKNNAGTLTCNSYNTLISGALGVALATVNSYTGGVAIGTEMAVWIVTTNMSRCFISYSTTAGTEAQIIGLTLALAVSFGPSVVITAKSSITAITGGGFSADLDTPSGNINTGVFISYIQSGAETPIHTDIRTYTSAGTAGTVQTLYNMKLLSTVLTGNPQMIAFRGGRPNQQSAYIYAGTFNAKGFSLAGKLLYGRLFSETKERGIGAPQDTNLTINISNFARVFTNGISGFFGVPVTLSTVGTIRNTTGYLISSEDMAWGGCDVKQDTYKGIYRQSTDVAGAVAFNGGSPLYCDGEVISELGHLEYPSSEALRLSFTVAGAGNLSVGIYSYVLVYEWIDGAGKVHLSAPSSPRSVTTTAGNQNVVIRFYSNNVGDKPVSIRVYRTAANGSIYTLVDYMVYGTRTTWNMTDNSSDSDISANEILYTLSGELSIINPGACQYITTCKDRAWGIFEEGLVKYSKKIEGVEPPEFADELSVFIEATGGAANSAAPLQDKVLIFKENRIYFVYGDGPNDTGTYGDFSLPQLITNVYGCISPMSVIAAEDFVYFQAKDGICRIGSNLQVETIGRDLDYYFASQPTILSSVVDSSTRQVKFSDGTNTYVWDYDLQQWSVYKGGTGAQSMAMIGNTMHWVNSSYLLQQEVATGNTLENGSGVVMTVGTGWISFDNVQGFERLYSIMIKCRKRGNHQLSVRLMYDGVPNIVETHIIDETTANSYIYADNQNFESSGFVVAADYADKPMTYRVKTSRQKVSSVKIILQDAEVGSTTGTVDVVGLAIEYGFKKNVTKLWMGDGRTV